MAEEGDTLKTRFFDCFELTKRETDKENKEFIMKRMGKLYEKRWGDILSMKKGLGLACSKDKAKSGVKGVVFGIRELIIKIEDEEC